MEFRFDGMLFSNVGNENSDVGHISCSCGSHLTRETQVPHPWFQRGNRGLSQKVKCVNKSQIKATFFKKLCYCFEVLLQRSIYTGR